MIEIPEFRSRSEQKNLNDPKTTKKKYSATITDSFLDVVYIFFFRKIEHNEI